MSGLILTNNGTNRIFRPDGKVVIAGPGDTETVKGEWSTAPRRDTNRIHYDFDGAEAEFDVTYAFNKNNQLIATIPAAANEGTDSESFAFLGRIVIDDNRDVSYELFDDTGEPTLAKIVVHGDLSFAPGLDKLTVTLPGGGTTQIRGNKAGANALETAPSATGGPGRDLIQFSATTLNTFDEVPLATRAIILFVGRWSMSEKGLVFNVGLNAGEVAIQFGGTYKGVTAGLAYYAKDGDQEIAFTIHGEHQFKRGGGSVNWLMSLGHSKQKIEAVAELDLKSIDKAGNKLTLGGKFQFVSEPGKPAPPKMDISLDATYQMNGSQLVFAADFQKNGDRPSYNLRLAGNYQVKGGEVKFLVQLSKNEAGQTLAVELGSVTDSKVQAHLSAVLTKSGSGKVSLSANFTISARWVNGDLMKIEKPVMSA